MKSTQILTAAESGNFAPPGVVVVGAVWCCVFCIIIHPHIYPFVLCGSRPVEVVLYDAVIVAGAWQGRGLHLWTRKARLRTGGGSPTSQVSPGRRWWPVLPVQAPWRLCACVSLVRMSLSFWICLDHE